MEEFDENELSFGDIIGLIQRYEESAKNSSPAYFEVDDYEHILNFYMDNREFGKALKVVDAAIEQHSFSSYFQVKRAELLANAKRFAEAMEALDVAEQLDPEDTNIYLIRADVMLWQGKHNEAILNIESGLKKTDEDEVRCELYLELADVYEDREEYDAVVDALCSAARLMPDSEEALNRLWFCTELTGNYERSVKIHRELVDTDPYAYLAWHNLGHAYAGLAMFEESLDAFGFAIAIEDTFDPAYVCSGDVLFNLGKYNDALVFYADALKIAKPHREVYLKMGECHEKLGDLSKSRSYLRKAINVDPYYDEAYFRVGETYRVEEDWSRAITSYERAVKLNKENLEYLAALAEAYLNIDENEKALDILERVFQLDPQSKVNWINLATAYFNVDNYRKAFQVLTEAANKFENSADIYYLRAVFYLQAGNRHEGLLQLEHGLMLNFEEHTIIFEVDDALLNDHAVIMLIEQYRPH